MYTWNILHSIMQLLPRRYRKPSMWLWLYSLVYPLESLYNSFLSFRVEMIKKVSFSGQVVYLEHVLNDIFDPTGRGIYISDGSPLANVYVYRVAESIDSIYVYNEAESDPSEDYLYNHDAVIRFDFIVNVPAYVAFDTNYLKGWIECYKQVGKTYDVVII